MQKYQDNETKDGRTGIVMLAGSIQEQAQFFLDKGYYLIQIANGYQKAYQIAVNEIKSISKIPGIKVNNYENFTKIFDTTQGFKIVQKYQKEMVEICVKAVLSIASLELKDVNFELIKIEGKYSKSMEDPKFINKIVIEREISHSQIVKEVNDAKIFILAFPFEPPKKKQNTQLKLRLRKNTMNCTRQSKNISWAW
eukprot:TRINITY_DN57919_c0_g2_i1.p2 TRINITY_DN57919_c0_g2~~TRINITY_DN57919_c0_g2_i1.p2  ORF type:complete len:196 (+),score=9.95 TRINITY_DN57919_c0_g2_i1:263-850(+)